MIVSELLDLLCESQDLSHPVRALISSVDPRILNTDILGSAHGIPSISVIEGDRLPFAKTCGVLVDEIRTFDNEGESVKRYSRIYVSIVVEYEDESYDHRFFDIGSVRHTGEEVVLVAEPEERLELREWYPPFDESQYADDEEESAL